MPDRAGPGAAARVRVAPIACLALLLAAAGCGLGVETPTHVRVITSVPAGGDGGMVRLITSSEFASEPGGAAGLELLISDTARVTVPFDVELEIGFHSGQRKLYVELAPDDATELTVRMRILIGGEPWYDHTLDMPESRHRFLYTRG